MKSFLKNSLGIFLFLVISIPKLLILIFSRNKYQKIIICQEGGFAHSIVLPDVSRRLFPGQKILLIFFFKKYQHNPAVKLLWESSGIKFILIPISFGFKVKQPFIFFNSLNPRIGELVLRKIIGRKLHYAREVYSQIPIEPAVLELAEQNNITWEHHSQLWSLGYFRLLDTTKAPKPRLPLNLRKRLERQIEFCAGKKINKFCSLYLRQKGKNLNFASTTSRVGSDFSAYTEVVRQLNNHGYFVLLHSDDEPPASFLEPLKDGLLAANASGIDRDTFALYLATECSFYIGEAGGGSWLPSVSGIPTLITNGFPFSLGHYHAMICFKKLRKKDGTAVDFKNFLWKYGYETDLQDHEYESLPASDLNKAIAYFLSSLLDPSFQEPEKVKQFSALFPPYSWFIQAHAKLCPYPLMSDHDKFP